jgi:hypothetical protein
MEEIYSAILRTVKWVQGVWSWNLKSKRYGRRWTMRVGKLIMKMDQRWNKSAWSVKELVNTGYNRILISTKYIPERFSADLCSFLEIYPNFSGIDTFVQAQTPYVPLTLKVFSFFLQLIFTFSPLKRKSLYRMLAVILAFATFVSNSSGVMTTCAFLKSAGIPKSARNTAASGTNAL